MIIIDEIGGIHEDGLGYNPHGIYCGECNMTSCINCIYKDIKEDIYGNNKRYNRKESNGDSK